MTDEALVERVLRAAEQVPAGTVVAYGDIAALIGVGPRQVGNIMAHWGSGVPWWRVTNRDGELPQPLLEEARRRWEAEGVALTPNGRGCRIAQHRADLQELGTRWEQAIRDLPG